jgi:hypothetical protein
LGGSRPGEREAADDLGAVVDRAGRRGRAGGEVDRVEARQAGVGVAEDGEGGAVLADVEAVGREAGDEAERADDGDDARVGRAAAGGVAVDAADANERVVDEVDAVERRRRRRAAGGLTSLTLFVYAPPVTSSSAPGC